jgi:foldase protein PrsA
MVLLAQHNGIMLDESEQKAALNAANEYYESLSEADIKAMDNVTKDTIQNLYEEQALAGKLYKYTIRDINPEVSDDEARTLTVQQILLKTYTVDDSGNRTAMSDSEKKTVYAKMEEIVKALDEGASFESMVETYNEADEGTVSFGKGEVDESLETAAFNLSTDQISDIIETEDGYMLIKCVTTFDKEETELNKIRIAEERRSEAFATEYDEFAKGLTKEINSSLWDSITLCDDPEVTTKNFFDIYNKYFED